jgi:hypothetical protein
MALKVTHDVILSFVIKAGNGRASGCSIADGTARLYIGIPAGELEQRRREPYFSEAATGQQYDPVGGFRTFA